jgi:phosphoribosyl-AMP cyclohydrolase
MMLDGAAISRRQRRPAERDHLSPDQNGALRSDRAMLATATPPRWSRPNMSKNHALEEGLAFTPRYDANGLIPAIATDAATGRVLMFAWMDAEALALTIETGAAHFHSRSRGRLWKKGEESGNILRVIEARVDCDQDVIWLSVAVEGAGVACHTGRTSCFYRILRRSEGGFRLDFDAASGRMDERT